MWLPTQTVYYEDNSTCAYISQYIMKLLFPLSGMWNYSLYDTDASHGLHHWIAHENTNPMIYNTWYFG